MAKIWKEGGREGKIKSTRRMCPCLSSALYLIYCSICVNRRSGRPRPHEQSIIIAFFIDTGSSQFHIDVFSSGLLLLLLLFFEGPLPPAVLEEGGGVLVAGLALYLHVLVEAILLEAADVLDLVFVDVALVPVH